MQFNLDESFVTVHGCMDGVAGNSALRREYDTIEAVFAEFCKDFGVTEDYVDGDDRNLTFGFTPPLPNEDMYNAAFTWWSAVRMPEP